MDLDQRSLPRESEDKSAALADHLLNGLQEGVKENDREYQAILGVLRLYYLSSEYPTQFELAAELGISDSRVSDYKSEIEEKLRTLSYPELADLDETRRFEDALRKRIGELIGDQNPAPE